jgi:hypothetical protein
MKLVICGLSVGWKGACGVSPARRGEVLAAAGAVGGQLGVAEPPHRAANRARRDERGDAEGWHGMVFR